MKSEDRLLLLCLRQNFTAEHVQAVSELAHTAILDWERIALTAELHHVSGLIHRNLRICEANGLEIPEKASQKLKLSVYKNSMLKESQKQRLIRALDFFRDLGLEVMLIKGAAVDICIYQNQDYILSNDIDIMVHARREDYSPEYYRNIERFLHAQGIEFEFFSHHDFDINQLLPVDYESVWSQSLQAAYQGYPVRLLSPIDMLLSLCINSNRKRYFRLKSICDISETIQANPGISWESVAERARAFQCENMVYIALLVTSMSIGCELPKNWEKNFKVNPVRRKVINKTVNYMNKHISLYPYPFTGISIEMRPAHLSLLLPYIGYTTPQITKKLSYIFRGSGN